MYRIMRSKGWFFALGIMTVVAATIGLDMSVVASRGEAHLLSAERKAALVAGVPCNSGLIVDFCIAPLGCDNTVATNNCGSAESACQGIACDNPGQANSICNEYASYYSVNDCEDNQVPGGCGHFIDSPSCTVSPVSGRCACSGTSSQRNCLSVQAYYNECKPE